MSGLLLAIVQPYSRSLATIESENLLAEREFDMDEFNTELQSIYLSWVYCSIVMGLIDGVLFGAGKHITDRTKLSPYKAASMISGIA